MDVLRLFEELPLVHVAAPMVRYSKYERAIAVRERLQHRKTGRRERESTRMRSICSARGAHREGLGRRRRARQDRKERSIRERLSHRERVGEEREQGRRGEREHENEIE